MEKEKFILPGAILLSAILIWGSLIFVQVNKQNSIENQKRVEIQYEKEIKEQELEIQKKELELKEDEKNKEYISKRKGECLDIYETESEKWWNTNSYKYDVLSDICYIEYTDKEKNKVFYKSFETYSAPKSFDMFSVTYDWWDKFLRKFYSDMESGNLYSAYSVSAKKIDYQTFNDWYKDVDDITIYSISQIVWSNKFAINADIKDKWITTNYIVHKTLDIDSSWNYFITDTSTISSTKK